MKKILITISLIILLGLGIFLLNKKEDLLQTNNILAIYITMKKQILSQKVDIC